MLQRLNQALARSNVSRALSCGPSIQFLARLVARTQGIMARPFPAPVPRSACWRRGSRRRIRHDPAALALCRLPVFALARIRETSRLRTSTRLHSAPGAVARSVSNLPYRSSPAVPLPGERRMLSAHRPPLRSASQRPSLAPLVVGSEPSNIGAAPSTTCRACIR